MTRGNTFAKCPVYFLHLSTESLPKSNYPVDQFIFCVRLYFPSNKLFHLMPEILDGIQVGGFRLLGDSAGDFHQ